MKLLDTHCHLDFENFDEDREKLVDEMKRNNIIALTNTTNRENYEYTKKLFKDYENIKVCPGLYPQDSEKISDEELEDYFKLIRKDKDKIVAIGEVGLDRHHTRDDDLIQIQEKRFRQMINIAIELDKPIIIHSRKMEQRVLEIIREVQEKTGFKKFQLHCFMGKKKLIKDIKELKVYCSIPLSILNTESFQILVNELPVKQLLVETDSPFLNPSKERNSPLNVPLIYDKIAEIKGYDKKEITNIIYRNYQKLTM